MANEFDPIRPVHPSWRGRPVPERGDDAKRPRRWPGEREDAPEESTDDSGSRPDRDPTESAETTPERSRELTQELPPESTRESTRQSNPEPPVDGAEGESGRNVDDYA